jgi:hypothetical protein
MNDWKSLRVVRFTGQFRRRPLFVEKNYKRSFNFKGLTFDIIGEYQTIESLSLKLRNTGSQAFKVALFGCPAYPDLNVNFTLNPNCSVDQLLLIDTAGQRYIEFIIELEDDKPEAETGKKIEALKNERSFVNDVAAMQTDATFSDATLECDGEVLQCHRFILAARGQCYKTFFVRNLRIFVVS